MPAARMQWQPHAGRMRDTGGMLSLPWLNFHGLNKSTLYATLATAPRTPAAHTPHAPPVDMLDSHRIISAGHQDSWSVDVCGRLPQRYCRREPFVPAPISSATAAVASPSVPV